MKETGIIRRIDDLGRIVIPREIRRTQGIHEGDPMEIFIDGDSIILKRYLISVAASAYTDTLKDIIRDHMNVSLEVQETLLQQVAALEAELKAAEKGQGRSL